MPVHSGSDSKGSYYQWGGHGKKYYYTSESGKAAAKSKATKQGQAAHANGYNG